MSVDYFDENDIIVTPVKCKSGTVKVSTKNLVLTKNAKLDGIALPEFDYWSGQTAIELKSSNQTGVLELFDSQSGCTIKKTINFGDYKAMELSFVKNQACKPNNGSITVSVKNPGASLVYSWSNGQVGKDKTTVSIPTDIQQTVKVTDAEGCSVMGNVTFLDADYTKAPTIALTSFDVCSDNVNNGLIESVATATIGGALSFAWDNGRTTPNNAGLGIGTHTVVVSEVGNPCTATGSANVGKLSPEIEQTCPGLMNGSIRISFKGKNASYKWENIGGGNPIQDLGVGRYCVVVTDTRAGGCRYEKCFDITEKTIGCESICNGRPFINPKLNEFLVFAGFGDCTNGVGSASFFFKENLTYTLLEGGNELEKGTMSGFKSFTLKEGHYSLEIKSNGTCTYSYPFQIKCCTGVKDQIEITSFRVTPKPTATSSGSIFLNVNRPNVNYAWTGPDKFSAVTQNIVNLTTEGEYCVAISGTCSEPVKECFTITDLGKCASFFTGITIPGSSACPDIKCQAGNLTMAFGALSPNNFKVIWNDQNNTAGISLPNVGIGSYSANVTNIATGCKTSLSGIVTALTETRIGPDENCKVRVTCGTNCTGEAVGGIDYSVSPVKDGDGTNCNVEITCVGGEKKIVSFRKQGSGKLCQDDDDCKVLYTCAYVYPCTRSDFPNTDFKMVDKGTITTIEVDCEQKEVCSVPGKNEYTIGKPNYIGDYCWQATTILQPDTLYDVKGNPYLNPQHGQVNGYNGYLYKFCNGKRLKHAIDSTISEKTLYAAYQGWSNNPLLKYPKKCPTGLTQGDENSLVQKSLTVAEQKPNDRKIAGINVYPNPFDDFITLDINLIQDEEFEIELLNNLGQSLYGKRHFLTSGKNLINIQPDNVTSGVYTVLLKAKGGSTFKFRLVNIK